MERQDIKYLLRDIVGPNVEMKDSGSWVSTHCLYAQWRHERGTDSNMSFGVSVSREGQSVFNCFSCKAKGPLTYMLQLLARYSGRDLSGKIAALETTEALGGDLPEWGSNIRDVRKDIPPPPPNEYTDLYDPVGEHPYLRKRGITLDISKQLDLRIDEADSHGHERILFPVYSHTGQFYGYTGRAVDDSVRPRIRDYFGLPKSHLLLGSEWVDPSVHKYIILVEGLFDFARLWSYRQPVVAAMHSTITPNQAAILKSLGLPVYVLFDNDKAGHNGRREVKKQLVRHVVVYKPPYPLRQIVDRRTGLHRPINDPAELRESEVRVMLRRAKLM